MGGPMTSDGSATRAQQDNSSEECRVLRQRCADLEQQLAKERAGAETALRAALSVVFAAGEESARIQLGLPIQRQQRPHRGHLRGLDTAVPGAFQGGMPRTETPGWGH